MAKVCRGCGTRKSEWENDPDAYIGSLEKCPGCERLQDEQRNIPEGEHGWHPGLLPREIALARAAELDDSHLT